MEETAFFLDLTIAGDVPIVLTGAQRPASAPDADGPSNLRDAIRVAADPQSRGRGVMIVMHGEIHTAREATKASPKSWTPLTRAVALIWAMWRMDRSTLPMKFAPSPLPLPIVEDLPRVDIIPMYAGADDAALRAALARGAAGLVIAGVGAGNVNHALFDGIQVALRKGIAVVISTRVPMGWCVRSTPTRVEA